MIAGNNLEESFLDALKVLLYQQFSKLLEYHGHILAVCPHWPKNVPRCCYKSCKSFEHIPHLVAANYNTKRYPVQARQKGGELVRKCPSHEGFHQRLAYDRMWLGHSW